MTEDSSLAALRARIDAIDDGIHDLLMQRTEVVVEIGQTKGPGPVYRPAREVELLRRIIGRHTGKLPGRTVVRIWRELLAATNGIQRPFGYAVFDPDGSGHVRDLARDQYGLRTKALEFQTANQVMHAVNSGDVTIGVLPVPRADDAKPWWPLLLADDAPRIVSGLPFVEQDEADRGRDALVVARIPAEETGGDRSYVAFETTAEVSRGTLVMGLERADLKPISLGSVNQPGSGGGTFAIEVDGFVSDDSPRLATLRAQDGLAIQWTRALGAYAMPLTGL